MRISICEGDKFMNIRIPSRMIFNGAIATVAGPAIISKLAKSNGNAEIALDSRAARAIFKEINRCRSFHPEWNLIEVESDGKLVVQIKL